MNDSANLSAEPIAALPAPPGPWIPTFSGRRFYPFSPSPPDVELIDIAHHLAGLNRWSGAGGTFYSVAQHSVRVSLDAPRDDRLAALFHEAAEGYGINDMASPVKRFMPAVVALEHKIMAEAVAPRFGFHWPPSHALHLADARAAAQEAEHLLRPAFRGEFGEPSALRWEDPWPAHYALARFLDRYAEITRGD